MNFTYAKWNNWDVIKCETGEFQLIIGISAGPRILSVKHVGGDNLLYQDTTDFKVGDWRIYGGHRFTIAPETAGSYYPDNDPCDVKITKSYLMITAKERCSGLQLSIMISESAEVGIGFNIRHILENNGGEDWVGALWAITCVPRSSHVFAFCTTSEIYYWPGTDPTNWQRVNKQMTIKSGNYKGKVGWYSGHICLNALQRQGTLRINCLDLSSPVSLIDNGSNVEIFVCQDFVELETLSRHLIVSPGQSASHLQQWRLLSQLKPNSIIQKV